MKAGNDAVAKSSNRFWAALCGALCFPAQLFARSGVAFASFCGAFAVHSRAPCVCRTPCRARRALKAGKLIPRHSRPFAAGEAFAFAAFKALPARRGSLGFSPRPPGPKGRHGLYLASDVHHDRQDHGAALGFLEQIARQVVTQGVFQLHPVATAGIEALLQAGLGDLSRPLQHFL